MHGFDRPGERSWVTPECTGWNRLVARSPLVAFPDVASAVAAEREASPWFLSLCGPWRFRLYDRPEAVPDDWAKPEFDETEFTPIEVPGNWTLQGHDRPHYTNVQMPFPNAPPSVPDENPTGIHRTRFHLPDAWDGRRVVLHFGGAESVLYVAVNGEPVGYSKDSRLPAEFDVTSYLIPGENLVAAMVVRWSDASFVEDQDHWWMAGLHREVFLRSTEQIHIEDLRLRADLDLDADTGRLFADVTLGSGDRLPDDHAVSLQLLDPKGRAVFREPPRGSVRHRGSPYAYRGDRVALQGSLRRPLRWSAETPNLYRAVVTLTDAEGRVVEVVSDRVGFRHVEVGGRELRVNGRAVLIKGVNRHDHDDVTGKTVTPESMRLDLVRMKQFNFNAVRTAHYPNDPRLLDLCDELGMYVIDEANVESHAFLKSLADMPRYTPALLDRVERMVRRDKNHACIIAWSLGNESGYGVAHGAMAGWVRKYDPSRPLHYEGALEFRLEPDRLATDLVCPMYASVDEITAWAERTDEERPLILCEYSHAMGNSNGSLLEYFEAFERHHGLQGGFIWDWQDQGLRRVDERGRAYWAYGGDFGDEPNDTNFNINGLVWPDREPHPAMFEFKKLAQPLAVSARNLKRGRLRVTSRHDFIDTGWLRGRFEVTVDGRVVQKGSLPRLVIAPGEFEDVELALRPRALEPGQEAFLRVSFETRREQPWAPKGHEVAFDQFALPGSVTRAPAAGARGRSKPRRGLRVSDEERGWRIEGEGFAWTVDGTSGALTGAWLGSTALLADRFELCLWRAPTDNDARSILPIREPGAVRWVDLGLAELDLDKTEASLSRRGGRVIVRANRALHVRASGARVEQRQRVEVDPGGDARLSVEVRIPGEIASLPRVGVVTALRPGFERLRYLGRGPHENYRDRRAGAAVGLYESSVAEQYVPYILPQENGNRCDTRWLTLARPDGPGLLVAASGDWFEFTASHFRARDLAAALHTHELEPRDEIVLHLDALQAGVGSGACGPDTLPAYRIGPGRHRFAFRLRAFGPGEDPGGLARRDPFEGGR